MIDTFLLIEQKMYELLIRLSPVRYIIFRQVWYIVYRYITNSLHTAKWWHLHCPSPSSFFTLIIHLFICLPIRNSPDRVEKPHNVRTWAILWLRLKFSWPNTLNCSALRKCCAPNSVEFDCVDTPAPTFQTIVHSWCRSHKMLNSVETPRHRVR